MFSTTPQEPDPAVLTTFNPDGSNAPFLVTEDWDEEPEMDSKRTPTGESFLRAAYVEFNSRDNQQGADPLCVLVPGLFALRQLYIPQRD